MNIDGFSKRTSSDSPRLQENEKFAEAGRGTRHKQPCPQARPWSHLFSGNLKAVGFPHASLFLSACMHGWMDGWVGGWMDGWMDRRACVRGTSVCMHACIHA